MEITHGSLFAGIGGFNLGFQNAGITTTWNVDIDPWCQSKLKKRFPEAEIFGDIREVGKHNLASVDIISGGFPCQPFSIAGKRSGAKDDRYLWPEMLRVINEVRPTWVVGENVNDLETMGFPISDIEVASRHITRYADQDHYQGIYTLKERVFVDYICEQFEEIGYDVQPFNIPAVALEAQHIRKRVWFVAHRQSSNDGSSNPTTVERQKSQSGKSGSGGIVAYTEGDTTRGLPIGTGKTLSRSGKHGENIPNTNPPRLPITARSRIKSVRESKEPPSRRNLSRANATGRSYWATEPDLGELVDGLPPELVARIGRRDITRDFPIPRVATGIPERRNKLKALGNAIYPPHAEMFGNMIKQIMEQQL